MTSCFVYGVNFCIVGGWLATVGIALAFAHFIERRKKRRTIERAAKLMPIKIDVSRETENP